MKKETHNKGVEMSKAQHTPGPWRVEGDVFVTGSDDHSILAGASTFHPDDICCANAERIVECVNACEQVADPSVVPELIAACRSMLHHARVGDLHKWSQIENAVVDVIRRAGPSQPKG